MTRNFIPVEDRKSKLKYIDAMYSVKPLKLMPYFNAVTLNMAADYLETSPASIKSVLSSNKDTIFSLGSKIVKREDFIKSDCYHIGQRKAKGSSMLCYEDSDIVVPNCGIRIFTPEAIFFMAMSLHTPVAESIREKILEVEATETSSIQITDCDLPVEVLMEVSEPVTDDGFRIFNDPMFGDVRTIEENGKVLFCGRDVAEALGYDAPRNAIERHCRYALKRCIPHPQNKTLQIEMSFIPEGDVYRLIVKSRLPEAERFEHWLFDEVVPTIRKHGMYASDELLDNPEFAIQVFQKLKEERERNRELTEANRNLLTTNQALVHNTREWKARAIINALIRKYASKRGNNYQMAWNKFYKELAYSKNICPKLREGKGFAIDKVKDSEWDDLIEVAAALCESIGINSGEVINEVNAERIHS